MQGLFSILDALPSLETATTAAEYSFGGQFLKMVLTLGAFVALLLGIAWIYRRLGLKRTLFGNAHTQIQILERRPLSQKSTLYLIEIQGKRLVIGDSPAGMACVADVTEINQAHPSFEEVLQQTVSP